MVDGRLVENLWTCLSALPSLEAKALGVLQGLAVERRWACPPGLGMSSADVHLYLISSLICLYLGSLLD